MENVKPEGWQDFPTDLQRSIIADMIDRTLQRDHEQLSNGQLHFLQAAFNDCGRRAFDPAFSFARAAELNDWSLQDLLPDPELNTFSMQCQLDILRTMKV